MLRKTSHPQFQEIIAEAEFSQQRAYCEPSGSAAQCSAHGLSADRIPCATNKCNQIIALLTLSKKDSVNQMTFGKCMKFGISLSARALPLLLPCKCTPAGGRRPTTNEIHRIVCRCLFFQSRSGKTHFAFIIRITLFETLENRMYH